MVGTIINTSGILIGGTAGLIWKKQLSPATQAFAKAGLGAFTVFYGLRLTWLNINGPFLHLLKQFFIVLLALMLGKMAGRLIGLQRASNRLGQRARASMEHLRPDDSHRWSNGFNTCAMLFCAAPLAILGSVHDGLTGYFQPLVIKALMDGLAMMGFVSLFGWSAILSALPVFAYQGTITLLAQSVAPVLREHQLIEPVNATGGLLIFCIALIIFEIKRVELADYLPSLLFAPLLTWLWK